MYIYDQIREDTLYIMLYTVVTTMTTTTKKMLGVVATAASGTSKNK